MLDTRQPHATKTISTQARDVRRIPAGSCRRRTGAREAAAKDLTERFARTSERDHAPAGNPSCDDRAELRFSIAHLDEREGQPRRVIIAITDANDAAL